MKLLSNTSLGIKHFYNLLLFLLFFFINNMEELFFESKE